MKQILLIFLTLGFINSYGQSSNYGDKYAFVKLLNEYRASKGLKPVQYDNTLEKAAKLQCQYNYSEHNDGGHFHPTYSTVGQRLVYVGYTSDTPYSKFYRGENCAVLFNFSQDLKYLEKYILQSYINSPTHNVVLLKGNIDKVGFYTIYDGKDVYNIMVVAN